MLIKAKPGWRHDRLQAIPTQAILRPEINQLLVEADAVPQQAFDCPIIKPALIPTDLEAPHVPVSWFFQSRRAVVPFVEEGRIDLMASLDSWCEAAEPLGVKHLVGGAGSGKTRVAAELCERMARRPGWITGFSSERVQDQWAVFTPNRSLLIVFDYVHQWEQEVQTFLARITTLIDEGRLKSKVRILLLSRSEGDLIERCDYRSVLATLQRRSQAFTIEIQSYAFTGDQRQAHLEAAFRAFCSPVFSPITDPILPDVTDPQYSSPLLVHIAAYFGSQGDPVPSPGTSDIQFALVNQLLQRESDIWLNLMNENGAKTFRSRGQAAAAVLILSLTRPRLEEAAALLTASLDFDGTNPLDRSDAVKAVSRLYPSSDTAAADPTRMDRVGALEPDLILEHLLATFPDRNRLLSKLHDHEMLRAPHRARFLQVLALSRDHYPAVETDFQKYIESVLSSLVEEDGDTSSLGELLVSSMPQILGGAVTKIRANEGNRVADYLASAIRCSSTSPALAETCAEAALFMPRPYPELSNLSLALAERAVEYAETVPNEKAVVAMLHLLGLFQADCGEWGRSIMSARRAINILEDLHETDVDHLHLKALNLNLLGTGLSKFNRESEASSALKAGLSISDECRLEYPERFEGLHEELSANMARMHFGTGNVTKALELLRTLQGGIGADVFPLPLLNNLGLFLQKNGELDESLALLERAASSCRRLVEKQPGAYRQLLVEILQNLSGTYSLLDRRSEALKTSKEAVEHAQYLHKLNPTAHVELLSSALDNLGIDLKATGDLAEAVSVIQQSLRLVEDRVEEDPTLRPSQAKSLSNLANVLAISGNLDDALEVLTSAIHLQRELVAQSPQSQGETLREMSDQLRSLIKALRARDLMFGLGRMEEE